MIKSISNWILNSVYVDGSSKLGTSGKERKYSFSVFKLLAAASLSCAALVLSPGPSLAQSIKTPIHAQVRIGDHVVTAAAGGFQVLNTCDPIHPQVAAEVNIDGWLVAADYHRERKILATSVYYGENSRVEFWDLSDILTPQLIGRYAGSQGYTVPVGVFSANGNHFAVLDDHIETTSPEARRLSVLDVSDLSAPLQVAALNLPDVAWKCQPNGNRKFLFCPGQNSIHTIDISEPAAPVLYSTLVTDNSEITDLRSSPPTVCQRGAGCSPQFGPQVVYRGRGSYLDDKMSVTSDDSHLYLARTNNGGDNLFVFDLSMPAAPQLTKTFWAGDASEMGGVQIDPDDQSLFFSIGEVSGLMSLENRSLPTFRRYLNQTGLGLSFAFFKHHVMVSDLNTYNIYGFRDSLPLVLDAVYSRSTAIPAADCPMVLGDANRDGALNNFDIDNFVSALTHPLRYEQRFGWLSAALDINGDGAVNNFDIDPMVDLITAQGPSPIMQAPHDESGKPDSQNETDDMRQNSDLGPAGNTESRVEADKFAETIAEQGDLRKQARKAKKGRKAKKRAKN